MKLKICYLPSYRSEWGALSYAKPGDSGLDIRAAIGEPVVIPAGKRAVIPNGIQCELEADTDAFEIQVRPRSGLAAKKGITVVNTPGTVDWGYRGEVMTILLNTGDEDFVINPGDRIAQMVVCPIIRPQIETVNCVGETVRGAGKFGSTGV